MRSEANLSTRELSALRPKLRDDLQIYRQDGNFVLEDPLAGTYFSIGHIEHHFLQMLDGSSTVSELVGKLSVQAQADALSEQAATTLVRSLADSGLLEGGGNVHADRVRDENHRQQDAQKLVQQSRSIVFWRIPLGNPDRFLDWISPFFGWLVSKRFFLIWIAVLIAGAVSVNNHWTRFREETAGMFAVGNLLLLTVIWVVIKIFHEGCHALVCKRFGGSVPEMGVVMFMFITPLGYVNASSSVKFPSKWNRIFVSAAGMYGELFLAGIAAIVWSQLSPGMLSRGLHEAIVISSVTTILFNANPLMRFDGYYILADLTGVPNLYAKAQSSANFWFRRYLLGADPNHHPVPEKDRSWWITIYGLAAFFWRGIVLIGILTLLSRQWDGTGLLIAIVIGLATILSFLQSVRKYLQKRARSEGVSRAGFYARIALIACGIGAVFTLVQITPSVKVPAVVVWKNDGEVRVECPGFVHELLVTNSSYVKEGEPLAKLRNSNEEARLEQLRLSVERSTILADRHLQSENISAYQAESKQLNTLRTQLIELERYVDTLFLTAPCDGIVSGRDLANLKGTYLDKGQLLCSIGRAETKQLVMALPEEIAMRLQDSKSKAATFLARGRITRIPAELTRVNPHASTQIPHFGLVTPSGGPLVARKILASSSDEDAIKTEHPGDIFARQFELVAPHFEAVANLSPTSSQRVETGEIGYVRIYAGIPQTLWELLRNSIGRSMRRAETRVQ